MTNRNDALVRTAHIAHASGSIVDPGGQVEFLPSALLPVLPRLPPGAPGAVIRGGDRPFAVAATAPTTPRATFDRWYGFPVVSSYARVF
jgi:hypothetical protein